ncbi:MAG: transglutaminase domain-containing protein, partial [Chloroflexota bacterium]
ATLLFQSPPDGRWVAIFEFWNRQLALLFDRVSGWVVAVSGGGSSTETIVFVIGLALATWLIAAYLAWSVYRQHRPLAGLTVVGLALALNTFYGQSGLYWVVVFVGLAVTSATYLDYLYREDEWERKGVDYSAEVRNDLLVYAAGVSIGIMAVAMAIPTINIQAIARAFQSQQSIVQAEETLGRAFAGINIARVSPRIPIDEGATNTGQIPRGFLLGNAPELTETVVMTATLYFEGGRPVVQGINNAIDRTHWRSVSYEVYTGRGWQRSLTEREEPFIAGQLIPYVDEPVLPPGQVLTLTQSVDWILDQRATRYTFGLPRRFYHDTVVFWRGSTDLVGVQRQNNTSQNYVAQSAVVDVPVDVLRRSKLSDVPPEIMARYTALPESVPQRVHDLAQEIAGISSTRPELLASPYDQAWAIETFLHQYPYSLDISLPPGGSDMVDYFLFDLQQGFCDYYASSMVVMARSVGLPARLAAGYLPQETDEAGTQTIRQINAHSWAEIYFAGIGWVEFEPTAPFAPPGDSFPHLTIDGVPYDPQIDLGQMEQIPVIPDRAPDRSLSWIFIIGVIALGFVVWRLWGPRIRLIFQRNDSNLDPIQESYARLQSEAARLDFPIQPGQTPYEYSQDLALHLRTTVPEKSQSNLDVFDAIEQLTRLFVTRQYSPTVSPDAPNESRLIWQVLKPIFRRAIWRKRIFRRNN